MTGAAGADRAQHGVARGVLALDELHDVDPVALQPHQRRPQPVGQGVGEPLAEDAVPGEHGVRRGGRRLAQLGRDVVVAAGRGEHQLGPPADRPRQRLVGRGVAGVQGEHDLGRRVELDAADGADHELAPSTPSSRGDRAVVLARLLLDVDAGQPHRQLADPGQVALGGEGQVGVAAAEVDDPQRVLERRPAQASHSTEFK